MASVVDICNLALAHLGEIPNISSIDPPEGSAHAEKCERFYPLARDTALEMRNWSFALKRVVLAQVENDHPSWQFKYALPADCIRPISVAQPGTHVEVFAAIYPDRPQPLGRPAVDDFAVEGAFIYTSREDVELLYLRRISDTTKFPPLFVSAVAWLLASAPIRSPTVPKATTKHTTIHFSRVSARRRARSWISAWRRARSSASISSGS